MGSVVAYPMPAPAKHCAQSLSERNVDSDALIWVGSYWGLMDLISLATSVHVVGGICWLQSLGFRVNSGHPGSESMPCKDFALLQCCVMSFLLLSPWGPLQPLMSSYNTVLGPGEPPGVGPTALSCLC